MRDCELLFDLFVVGRNRPQWVLQQAAAWRLYTRVVGIKTHSLEQDGEMEFEKKRSKQTSASLLTYPD